jgi:hypothetical protein
LTKLLASSIDSLWRCAVCIEQPQSKQTNATLHTNISAYLQLLEATDAAARRCDVTVSPAAVTLIDGGLNCELESKARIDAMSNANDSLRAQIFAVATLEQQLKQRLDVFKENQQRTNQSSHSTSLPSSAAATAAATAALTSDAMEET